MPVASERTWADPRRWSPPHHDVPSRGRPLSRLVAAAGAPYRRLLDELALLPPALLATLAEPFAGPASARRSARLLAGVAAIAAALCGEAVDVAEALEWFLGEPQPDERLRAIAWHGEPDERLVGLLAYVLDPFGVTTRRAVLGGSGCAVERSSRKARGTFYTPGDVARSLAAEVVGSMTQQVLDPACGSGVFLRAALTRLAAERPVDEAVGALHGVDLDPLAVDACALLLTHDWIARRPLDDGELPLDRFLALREHQLVCADALELFAAPAQEQLAPAAPAGRRELPQRFDAILMNPPFAPAGPVSSHVRAGYASLRAATNPSGINMTWPFWELAARATAVNGRAGVVLPLSVAYADGAAARAARRAVFARASWELRFFDRAPDALFGDDVKQRVALALTQPGAPGRVRTSGLRRWSADRRAEALRAHADAAVELAARDGEPLLKIGSSLEREAIERLSRLGGTLGDGLAHARLVAADELVRDDTAIAVAPTAYNWIGAYRSTRAAAAGRRGAAGKLAELLLPGPEPADAAYALLASRVYLWWWRASGDLFHVPLADLAGAPFPLHRCEPQALAALAEAGRACWAAALAAPVVAVNRGVTTVAYAPPHGAPALDDVDRAVGSAFGLSGDLIRFVKEDAERIARAGRNTRRHATDRRAEGSEPPHEGGVARVHEDRLVDREHERP